MTISSKPHSTENEYFVRREFEKRKKELEKRQKSLEEEKRREIKERHYMRCPKCGMELVEIEFNEVKIDKCSSCHGIFLDDGELEQLMKPENSGLLGRFFQVFQD